MAPETCFLRNFTANKASMQAGNLASSEVVCPWKPFIAVAVIYCNLQIQQPGMRKEERSSLILLVIILQVTIGTVIL